MRLSKLFTIAILFCWILTGLGPNSGMGQGLPKPAGSSAAKGLDARINGPVEARGVDLSTIIATLQQASNLQIILGQGINQKVTFSLQNPTVREVLDSVLPANGLGYVELENGVIRIDKQEVIAQLQQPELELMQHVFTPNFIDIAQVMEALEQLKSPEGNVVADPDSRQIIVTDVPEVIQNMDQLLQQLDVRTETRLFQIKYASAQEIADQLLGIINTVEGELVIDARNNLILITDTPDRLAQAAAIIEQLDVEIEFVAIPLAFALPEDVLPFIEGFLTEMGFVDIDPRTSRILIQDIPSVIEQVRKVVKMLDIPTRQVWVEADIVRLNMDKTLTLGTSADFGKDIGAGGSPSNPDISGSTDTVSNFFSFNPFLSTSGSGFSLLDVSQGNYRFQIDAMVERSEAEIIASPRLLIQDGEYGEFNLGSEEPYATQNYYGGYYGGGSNYNTYTQQARRVGTLLSVEVYASEAGYIEMIINIEDTSARRVELSNLGEGLAVDGSFIDTAVTVKSGRTVVLGGIINRKKSKSRSGVPILGSLPVVGGLFSKRSTEDEKQKLLIFITPRLVNIDDPYDFAQIDNIQRFKDMQETGVTKFLESDIQEEYIDWSNEAANEQEAIEKAIGNQNSAKTNATRTTNSKTTKTDKKTLNQKRKSAFRSGMNDGVVLMKNKKR